ncbi:YadA-like family protein [Pelagibaculum spongiae]|uniref:Trimeric autotransporter adhesin YadA-like C-terminal membrane anchor domain-containing protein n=1 Tax=Pelagibaculum spongiae TaxID=2080658 RepID=A0A2V1GZN7_9GAMM|nr:YadA C-terminal domain-containing protein [Pelagibaculum spongiae]PVZ72514.1 hypothetical protein DC094_05800 [Pelagibaculum spongiae]
MKQNIFSPLKIATALSIILSGQSAFAVTETQINNAFTGATATGENIPSGGCRTVRAASAADGRQVFENAATCVSQIENELKSDLRVVGTAVIENQRALSALQDQVSISSVATAGIDTNTDSIGANTDSIGDNTASIGANSASIGDNTASISDNTASIGANTASIDINTASIGANTDSIGANTASIGANTASIGNNANDIQSNGQNIASNLLQIQSNDRDIKELQTDLAATKQLVLDGIAIANAFAGIPQAVNGKSTIGFGVGNYQSANAIAVGISNNFGDSNQHTIKINFGSAFERENTAGSVGYGYSW